MPSLASLSYLALAAGARLAGALSEGFDASECDVPDFGVSDASGESDGGDPFCASKWKSGTLIKHVRAKADGDGVRGLRIVFTDDDVVEVGAQIGTDEDDDNREGEVEIDPLSDTFTNIQTWSNGWHGCIGRLVVETSGGQGFDVGNGKDEDEAGKTVDLGKSGMLIGIKGRHGGTTGAIDNIEFMFAREKIVERAITDMELSPSVDELNARTANVDRGFQPEYFDVVHHVNRLPSETTVWVRGEKQVSTSTSITKTVSDTFGLSVGFEYTMKMGIPLIAEGTATFKTDLKWEHTETTASTTEETHSRTFAWQNNAPVKPNSAIRCYAWAFKGDPQDITWTGNSVLTFEDGMTWSWPSSGDYNTVNYSETYTTCESESIDDAEGSPVEEKVQYASDDDDDDDAASASSAAPEPTAASRLRRRRQR